MYLSGSGLIIFTYSHNMVMDLLKLHRWPWKCSRVIIILLFSQLKVHMSLRMHCLYTAPEILKQELFSCSQMLLCTVKICVHKRCGAYHSWFPSKPKWDEEDCPNSRNAFQKHFLKITSGVAENPEAVFCMFCRGPRWTQEVWVDFSKSPVILRAQAASKTCGVCFLYLWGSRNGSLADIEAQPIL